MNILNRIPIHPPLQPWLIVAVEVINQPAIRMELLAGKAVEVGVGQRTGLGQDVSKGIIGVFGGNALSGIRQRVGVKVNDEL